MLSLLLAGIYLCLPIEAVPALAASLDAPWYTHLCSQWLHASPLHLLLNLYVLWLMRFTWKEVLIAYVLSIPATFASFSGAVGFSSVIYALMGIRLPQVRMPRRDWTLFLVANAITAFVPGIAFGVHSAAFALAVAYVWLKRISDEYRGACKGR